MKLNNGFILIHRQLLEWEWYDDIKVCRLFIHCLLKANHSDKKHKGELVKRGTFLTSRDLLSRETKLTPREVRTALDKLIKTNELTNVRTPRGSVITVVNYDKYQKTTSKKTRKRPTNDQLTTNDRPVTKNDKEDIKNEKKNSEALEKAMLDFKKMRVKIRKPLTERAEQLIRNDLEKLSGGNEPIMIQILENSIKNSWQGVFPLKESKKPSVMQPEKGKFDSVEITSFD